KNKDPVRMGEWHFIGPFDNTGMQGFAHAYPPEKEIDLAKKYKGKRNLDIGWQKGKFVDGQVNNLAIFPDNIDAVAYLYREIECTAPFDMPVSLGSDDTLTVWLNGQKILSENVYRGVAPDQSRVVLKLKAGKNQLLMKVCQGGGEWA